ncbi:PHP domain-containing protein [Jiangella sp. DSM 45060]|uniref:PHP domain-containing protein n=1 Tax=Jiangella sp. DSM 45060 TaxID=1798224 RepID=UPI000ABBF557|nr:DUF3604 domain-containing protein [Jiangella sp. DSM 45060]
MSDSEHEHHHATAPGPRSAVAGAGGLILAGGSAGTADSAVTRTATGQPGAARASRLTRGRTLVHADLHNHTMLSDGAGDPALAYESMRSAGLDVAALTDHATLSDGVLSILDSLLPDGVNRITGLSRGGWRRTRELADAADEPGVFTAIRGFEWTNPLLGHVNVWFTDAYTDVLDATLMGGSTAG